MNGRCTVHVERARHRQSTAPALFAVADVVVVVVTAAIGQIIIDWEEKLLGFYVP